MQWTGRGRWFCGRNLRQLDAALAATLTRPGPYLSGGFDANYTGACSGGRWHFVSPANRRAWLARSGGAIRPKLRTQRGFLPFRLVVVVAGKVVVVVLVVAVGDGDDRNGPVTS